MVFSAQGLSSQSISEAARQLLKWGHEFNIQAHKVAKQMQFCPFGEKGKIH